MKVNSRLFVYSLCMLLCNHAFARECIPFELDDHRYDIHPYFSLAAGAIGAYDLTESRQFPVINGGIFTFNAHNYYQIRGLLGGSAGFEFQIDPNFILETGLSLYATNLTAKGTVTQGVDLPSFSTYSFRYRVQSRQLLIETKLLTTFCDVYHPYASFGVGVGFNRATNYTVDNPRFLTFTPQFSNTSLVAFTYNVGLGVDRDVNDNVRLGLGYRFTNLGRIKWNTGRIDNLVIPYTLSKPHMYANELFAQVTVVA